MDWFNLLGFDDFLMSFVIVSVSGLTMLFRKFYETPDDFTMACFFENGFLDPLKCVLNRKRKCMIHWLLFN